MVRSTLLPNRLWGATLENRGVLHSVWPGPLWTDFSPIERTSQKSFGLGIPMIFDDLSHGVHDFFVEGPETWDAAPYWSHFGGHNVQNHQNALREAARRQKHENIGKNKATCQVSDQSVD